MSRRPYSTIRPSSRFYARPMRRFRVLLALFPSLYNAEAMPQDTSESAAIILEETPTSESVLLRSLQPAARIGAVWEAKRKQLIAITGARDLSVDL